MKKIAISLIAFAITFSVNAQQTEKVKSTTKVKKTTTTQDYSKKTEVATLDGKVFKIVLSSKETGSTNTTPATNPAIGENKSGTEMAMQNNQMDVSGLNASKAKLRFENGMIKTSFKKMMSINECPYRITSGTSQLATFMATCNMTPYTSMKDEQMNKNVTEGNTIMGNGETNKTTTATTTTTTSTTTTTAAMNSAYISGVVDGDSIHGTITFNSTGTDVTYSFTGSVASKKDSEDLGMR